MPPEHLTRLPGGQQLDQAAVFKRCMHYLMHPQIRKLSCCRGAGAGCCNLLLPLTAAQAQRLQQGVPRSSGLFAKPLHGLLCTLLLLSQMYNLQGHNHLLQQFSKYTNPAGSQFRQTALCTADLTRSKRQAAGS